MLNLPLFYENLLKANTPTTISVGGRIYSFSAKIPVFSKQTIPTAFEDNVGIKPTIYIKQDTVNELSQELNYAVYVSVYGFNITPTVIEQIASTILNAVGDNGISGCSLVTVIPDGFDEQLRCSISLLKFRVVYKWQELQLSPYQ